MAATKKTFPIKGMHCASCVRLNERALKKVPGVTDAVVNLASEKATITYDDITCTPEDFKKAVASVGYTLETASHSAVSEKKVKQKRTFTFENKNKY